MNRQPLYNLKLHRIAQNNWNSCQELSVYVLKAKSIEEIFILYMKLLSE